METTRHHHLILLVNSQLPASKFCRSNNGFPPFPHSSDCCFYQLFHYKMYLVLVISQSLVIGSKYHVEHFYSMVNVSPFTTCEFSFGIPRSFPWNGTYPSLRSIHSFLTTTCQNSRKIRRQPTILEPPVSHHPIFIA